MVEKSIQQQIPVAICFKPEESEEIRPVAGFGIPQIIEQRPDQTTLIFMSGVGKVRLEIDQRKSVDSLLMTEGEAIDEVLISSESLKPKYLALSEALIRWIRLHIQDGQQREIFIRGLTGPQEVIGAFAAYLIFDYDLQYELMELFSIDEQIIYLYRLLESGKLASV